MNANQILKTLQRHWKNFNFFLCWPKIIGKPEFNVPIIEKKNTHSQVKMPDDPKKITKNVNLRIKFFYFLGHWA